MPMIGKRLTRFLFKETQSTASEEINPASKIAQDREKKSSARQEKYNRRGEHKSQTQRIATGSSATGSVMELPASHNSIFPKTSKSGKI